MNRRKFIYSGSGLIAGGIMLSYAPLNVLGNINMTDLCLVESLNPYEATLRAVHELGGISKFVPDGSSVGFLINSDFEEPGTYAHPDISLALLNLCLEAGAKEIVMLQIVSGEYWQRSSKFEKHSHIIDKLVQVETNKFPATFNEKDFQIISKINGASLLRDIEIVRKLEEIDVFINVPILKHHASTILTGALKNMMGLCTRNSNVKFHLGSNVKNDPEYLGQCIAELNLVRKPDLVVADATEFITGNGPSGPGPLKKLNMVVAGTDPVAVDAYGAGCLDMAASDIIAVNKAFALGIGEMDISKLSVTEIQV